MVEMTVSAYAKLNLTLDITGVRGDGYHTVEGIFQTVSLSDTVRVVTGTGGGIRVAGENRYVPSDENNLVCRAAAALFQAAGLGGEGVTIYLDKHIPVSAGLGGGSADAAAVINALNALYKLRLPRERLIEIALQVGADVPFCLFGRTMLVSGIGERLTRLKPMPPCHFVLVRHGRKRSTAAMYEAYDALGTAARPNTAAAVAAVEAGDLNALCEHIGNAFLPLWADSDIPRICRELTEQGALCVSLTGSGPTVFGVFAGLPEARRCFRAMKEEYGSVYLCRPV